MDNHIPVVNSTLLVTYLKQNRYLFKRAPFETPWPPHTLKAESIHAKWQDDGGVAAAACCGPTASGAHPSPGLRQPSWLCSLWGCPAT